MNAGFLFLLAHRVAECKECMDKTYIWVNLLADFWLTLSISNVDEIYISTNLYLVNNIGFGWLPPWLIVPRLLTGSLCFFLWWMKEELSGPVQLQRSHL